MSGILNKIYSQKELSDMFGSKATKSYTKNISNNKDNHNIKQNITKNIEAYREWRNDTSNGVEITDDNGNISKILRTVNPLEENNKKRTVRQTQHLQEQIDPF